VVLIPGIGMFSFAKTKMEARVTGEFYTNAVHVMEGATALGAGHRPRALPQAGPAASTEAFTVHSNYVAIAAVRSFRIEYWQLEEAKIRRQPPEKELRPRIAFVVGGGNGVGRETALWLRTRTHVVVADLDLDAARTTSVEAEKIAGRNLCRQPRLIFVTVSPSANALREALVLRRARHHLKHCSHLPVLTRRTNK